MKTALKVLNIQFSVLMLRPTAEQKYENSHSGQKKDQRSGDTCEDCWPHYTITR